MRRGKLILTISMVPNNNDLVLDVARDDSIDIPDRRDYVH